MDGQSYIGRKDAEALEEYYQGLRKEVNKSPQGVDKSTTSAATVQPTLADIRRRNQAESEALRDEAHLKRFRILNYTSEDSALSKTERRLKTYYCAICGAHCLITDADVSDLPRRKTDGAYVLLTCNHDLHQLAAIALKRQDLNSAYFVKKYTEPGETVAIRRTSGVDLQTRLNCRDCGYPLGYVPVPLDTKTPCLDIYFFSDSLLNQQCQAAALS